MRIRNTSLLCSFLALSSLGPAQTEDKPASVDGIVINAMTGEPVLRAHVALRASINGKQEQYGAVTNAAGKFSITSLPAGNWFAAADRVGFIVPVERDGRRGVAITLRPGDKKEDLRLKLTPAGAITGRVLDADGQPMETVIVRAELGSGMGPMTTTDEQGHFRIGGMTPGKYRVKASLAQLPLPREVRTDGTAEAHYGPTYFPSSTDKQSATRLEVRSGAEINGVEIRMIRAPVVRVGGIISGMPPGKQGVSLEFRQGNSSQMRPGVKPDGTFEAWNIDPGKYRLSAVWGESGRQVQTAPVEIEVGLTNVDNIELRLVEPSDISGQVEFDDEQAKQPPPPPQPPPPRTGRQTAAPKPPPRMLRVVEIIGNPSFQAEIADDGSFRLENVAAGRYRMIPTWPGVYVKSMRLGQTGIDGNILDLHGGSGGAALGILLSSAMGEVAGTVNDDKGPAAHARVAMMLESAEPGTSPMFRIAQADGTYRFTNVTPGKYKLAALDDDDLTVQGLEDYEDVLLNLEVRPSDKLTKDLKRHGTGGK